MTPVIPPEALSTPVEYPAGAGETHQVVLELTVDVDGTPRDVVVVAGAEPFATAALRAAAAWRFTPASRNERPVAARLRVAVEFVPPQAGASDPAETRQADALTASPGGTETASVETATAPSWGEDIPDIVVEGAFTPPPPQRLSRAEVRQLPGAFGDPFRAVEVLPSAVPIISGLPYFFVRGAPSGNVGYFFDGIPVPALYHFAAGPAVLHPAFIDGVELHAGGYPAYFGRFAGGILTGNLPAPTGELHGESAIRLVDSGGMVEVPFAGGRGNAMLGGRYSYTGAVLSLVADDISTGYWDYQARVSFALDADDTVEIFAFGSGDTFRQRGGTLSTVYFQPEPPNPRLPPRARAADEPTELTMPDQVLNLDFHRIDLRWDRALASGNLRQAITWGRDLSAQTDEFYLQSELLGARSEAELRLSPDKRARFGLNARWDRFRQVLDDNSEDPSLRADAPRGNPRVPQRRPSPADLALLADARADPTPADLGFGTRDDFTLGVYGELSWRLTPKVLLTPGLRADFFTSGPRWALGVDPRLAVRYQLTPDTTLVHAAGVAHQGPSLPVTLAGIKPTLKGGLQRSWQHSAGVETKLPGKVEGSATLFQNAFFNMTDLLGAGLPERGAGLRSMGHAYGLELLVRRDLAQRLGGLLSYAISRSERSIGRYSGLASFDRTHVVNLVLSYNLGRNWRFGNRLLLYTGRPTNNNLDGTETKTTALDDLGVSSEAEKAPPPRTRPFWRLDWRLEKRWSWSKTRYVAAIVEVVNTTLNEEVISYSCDSVRCSPETLGPVTLPLLGVEGAF